MQNPPSDALVPSYLHAYSTRSGHYVAHEDHPDAGEGVIVHRECPTDLIDAIVETWPPIVVVVAYDADLRARLYEGLPPSYDVRSRPPDRSTP